jgi:uncharacterized protein
MKSLEEFFAENRRAAIGLSGGVDSSYLLYAGLHCGADIRPYFVKTAFQPRFELEDAQRICRELGTELRVLELDVLASEAVRTNPPERCYHCKRLLFSTLREHAAAEGYTLLLDGTNASDPAEERPGMRAIAELRVRSPLRECGLAKADVRRLADEAGLFTAHKPSYACLATRIPSFDAITKEKLSLIEAAEDALFAAGYSDFRVRLRDGGALLQFPSGQLDRAYAEEEKLLSAMRAFFPSATIDPKAR